MARSSRAGARREMLRRIKKIKASVVTLQWLWIVETTVWEFGKQEKGGNVPIRPREEHEYPENQPGTWYGTVREIDQLITELGELRDYCVDQYHLTSGAKK